MIGSFLAVVIALTVTVLLLTRPSKPKPVFQGNRIEEAEEYRDSIEDYDVATFDNYSDFQRSEWANAKTKRKNESLMESCYTESFFEKKKLALIAFSFEYSEVGFEILSAEEKAGILSVSVIGIRRVYAKKTPSTYFFFYETDRPLPEEFSFSIVASRSSASSSSCYAKSNDEYVVFEEEETPVLYRISSYEDARAFAEEENSVWLSMIFMMGLRTFAKQKIEQSDAVILRYKGKSVDLCGICLEGDELILWEVEREASRSFETSKALMVLVPKDAKIKSLRYEKYRQESDPERRSEACEYTLVREESEGNVKYKTEKIR